MSKDITALENAVVMVDISIDTKCRVDLAGFVMKTKIWRTFPGILSVANSAPFEEICAIEAKHRIWISFCALQFRSLTSIAHHLLKWRDAQLIVFFAVGDSMSVDGRFQKGYDEEKFSKFHRAAFLAVLCEN